MREFYRFQVCWHPTTANATSTVTITGATTVSYTHLTLPTIYSV